MSRSTKTSLVARLVKINQRATIKCRKAEAKVEALSNEWSKIDDAFERKFRQLQQWRDAQDRKLAKRERVAEKLMIKAERVMHRTDRAYQAARLNER